MFNDFELVCSYTQNDAIEDGTLVDLSTQFPDLMASIELKDVKVVCTSAVFEHYIALTPAALRACNDVKGRAYDLLWMMSHLLRWQQSDDPFLVTFLCVTNRIKPSRVTVRCVPTTTDNGFPSIAITLPTED